MAAVNIGEIVATTLRHRNGKYADNFLQHNAFLARLLERGNVKPVSGGRVITEEIMYQTNPTVGWFEDFETLDTTPANVIDAAEYDWKQLAGTVSISGLEGRIKNASREAIINLLSARIENLEDSLRDTLAGSVYSDGTTAKEIGGLQQLVQTDPTSNETVGGINQSTQSWWQNQQIDGGAITSSTIRGDMNDMWLRLLRGSDRPDFIVADENLFTLYEEALQSVQQVISEDKNTTFESVRYKSADVFYDDRCPTNRMYMLNTKYLCLRPHATGFHALPERHSINQDATVTPIVWAGNITTSGRKFQGVIWT